MQQAYNDIRERWQCNKRLKHKHTFLIKLATLLKEGYTFYDSLHMLAPHHMTDEDESLQFVSRQLSEGHTMTSILAYFGIQPKYLMTLQLAEQRGHFEQSLAHVAKQMERHTKNRQAIIKLMTYPVTLFFLLVLLLIGFRQFFLPQMSSMFYTTSEQSVIELTISNILLHLPDLFLLMMALLTISAIVAVTFVLNRNVSAQIQLIYKLYPIRYFFQLALTKQLAEALGTLLTSGLSLQDALQILSKQQYQRYIQYLSHHLFTGVTTGLLLSQAIERLSYFQADFYSCTVHGEKGGNLGKELIMYSERLVEKQQSFVNTLLSIVQPLFFCLIAICILGAYLAILLPMYEMIDYV